MIGSSYSAEDIGMQSHKMGASSITLSYRTTPMAYDWPANTVERPLVTHFFERAGRRHGTTVVVGQRHDPVELSLARDVEHLTSEDATRGVHRPKPARIRAICSTSSSTT